MTDIVQFHKVLRITFLATFSAHRDNIFSQTIHLCLLDIVTNTFTVQCVIRALECTNDNDYGDDNGDEEDDGDKTDDGSVTMQSESVSHQQTNVYLKNFDNTFWFTPPRLLT